MDYTTLYACEPNMYYQLHHHTLLIKLTYVASLNNIPYTWYNLRSLCHYAIIVTRAPYQTYIALTLFQIALGQPIWFFQSLNSYNWSSLLYYSLKHSLHIPSSTTYGTLRNCFSYPTTSKLIRDRVQSTKTQYSVPSFFFFFCYSLFKFDIQNYVIVISLVTIY